MLQHCIDVGVELCLATFVHHDDDATTLLDVASDVLQLLRSERESRTSQQKQVRFFQGLQLQLLLVDLALIAGFQLLNNFLVAL